MDELLWARGSFLTRHFSIIARDRKVPHRRSTSLFYFYFFWKGYRELDEGRKSLVICLLAWAEQLPNSCSTNKSVKNHGFLKLLSSIKRLLDCRSGVDS